MYARKRTGTVLTTLATFVARCNCSLSGLRGFAYRAERDALRVNIICWKGPGVVRWGQHRILVRNLIEIVVWILKLKIFLLILYCDPAMFGFSN